MTERLRTAPRLLFVVAGCVSPLLFPMTTMATRTVYISNFDSDNVSVARVDGEALEVTALVPTADGAEPLAGAMTPDGAFLYYANFGDARVSAFATAADGSLDPLGSFAPNAGTAVSNASGIAVDPTGSRLFVSYFNGGNAGSVAAFTIEDDGSLSPVGGAVPSGGDGAAGVALTPDGRFLYVANMASGTVSTFAVEADGSLHGLSQPVTADTGTLVLAMAPDGSRLYAANALADTISAFAIAADGSLQAIGDPVPARGPGPRGVLVAPDGRTLYVAHYNTGHNGSLPGSVAAFSLGDDGIPVPLGDVLSSRGNGAEALVLSPDGKTLHVANFGSSTVATFAIAANGALTPRGDPVATGGAFPDFQSIVFTPNQGPTAAFSSMPGNEPGTIAFDATASFDPDGSVARFDWDFGDGTRLPDGGPRPVHTYATPGAYRVTLTVTDDEGCSDTLVFTGQTTICAGAETARIIHDIVTSPRGATPVA